MLTGYCGTYASPNGRGVYRFDFDERTGRLSGPELVFRARDAKCLCRTGGALAAPVQEGERAGIALFAPDGRELAKNLFETKTGCYLLREGNRLYSANYHEGTVTVLDPETLAVLGRAEAGPEAGCHQVISSGGLFLVPCLELDEVRLYDGALEQVGKLSFPAGTGPRHGVMDRAGRRLFLVSERSRQLFVFRAAGRDFVPAGTFPAADSGECAAVRLSRDERFLYVSTRGADVLTVFRLRDCAAERVRELPCGGRHPRDFDLTPDGRWLLCLNRDSDNLVSFPVDRETGLPGAPAGELKIPTGSGILLPGDMEATI
jgi:6-phosphogluconolactonase